MERKRYWYFVTSVDMGDDMSLSPRIPSCMANDEPKDIKRICVAPTAAHALSGVPYKHRTMHIYRTERKVTAKKAWDVPDAPLTKEHWLTRSTAFTRVTTVELSPNAAWVHSECGGSPGTGWYRNQQKAKKQIVKSMLHRDKRLARIVHANEAWKLKGGDK